MEISDRMIYAFAGEPEITATDAHCIKIGLEKVLALPEVQEMCYYEHMDRIDGTAEMNAQAAQDNLDGPF